jgi:hypothetical protein
MPSNRIIKCFFAFPRGIAIDTVSRPRYNAATSLAMPFMPTVTDQEHAHAYRPYLPIFKISGADVPPASHPVPDEASAPDPRLIPSTLEGLPQVPPFLPATIVLASCPRWQLLP